MFIRANKKGFNLIELLVVIFVIALLMGLLAPALSSSRSGAKEIVCRNNLRQLIIANNGYAGDNGGNYVPGEPDVFSTNKRKWYGVRESTAEKFDHKKGPLASYVQGSRLVCPQAASVREISPLDWQYDSGSGGYGYNVMYIGSTMWIKGLEDEFARESAKTGGVRKPGQTVMFADTVMARFDATGSYYIEYSVAEARYFVIMGQIETIQDPAPSIHFRHKGKAQIGWADGHVGAEVMARTKEKTSEKADVGWFAPLDNSLFDLN